MLFEDKIKKYFDEFKGVLETKNKDWSIKGFIDIYKNIYTISLDTKVISKVIELMIFPIFVKFAKENNYELILSSHQNHYPDITFIDKETGEKIALDIKTTYKINHNKVNGMTLGTFTGYFRNRNSKKNITFPYNEYSKHYVFGVIYERSDMCCAESILKNYLNIDLNMTQRKLLELYLKNPTKENLLEFANSVGYNNIEYLKNLLSKCLIDERKIYNIKELNRIMSVIKNFEFFIQEKWKIAIDRPGSGNTKNIGSTTNINELINGTALFTKFKNGQRIFDDYWMNYLTKDMAKSVGFEKPPYTNIKEYFKWRGLNYEDFLITKKDR